MQIIGVVGGIAGGKSEVTQRLMELGAVRLDADRAGHEALRDPAVRAALRERWGEAVFQADGSVDRGAVAQRVFGAEGNSEAAAADRRFLERLTHPLIEQKLVSEIERQRADGGVRCAVVDAALLFEAGWDRHCDHILFVDTPDRDRLERARLRGWTDDHFRAREAAQMSLDEKRRRAHVVFDNRGTREELRRQVDAWWQHTHNLPDAASGSEPSLSD